MCKPGEPCIPENETDQERFDRIKKRIEEVFSGVSEDQYPLILAILSQVEGGNSQKCAMATAIFQEVKNLTFIPDGRKIIQSFTEQVREHGFAVAMAVQATHIVGVENAAAVITSLLESLLSKQTESGSHD